MKNTYPYIFFGNETKEVIKNVDIVRNKYVIRKELIGISYPAYSQLLISILFPPISFMIYLGTIISKNIHTVLKIKKSHL